MWRALVVGSLLWLTGCGAHVSRLPTLDYAHQARLDVRFDDEPMQLDVLHERDPSEQVVAHCEQRCSLSLPNGRYRIRALGSAPSRERTVDIQQTTRVAVRPGNSVQRGLGIGFAATGGVASLALPIGAVMPLCDRIDGDCGRTPLAITGLVGLGVLTGGLILLGTSGTQLDVSTEFRSAPAAFVDGNGAGVKF
jgi:hypothetical protein